jgi:nucleotide-binding universal stress UspA family protein
MMSPNPSDPGESLMAYKTILVHLDAAKDIDSRLDIAFALAQKFDAHLVGLYALSVTPLPGWALAEGRYRGYVRVEVERGKLTADLRAMASVAEREAACHTLARYIVEDGRPGPQRA